VAYKPHGDASQYLRQFTPIAVLDKDYGLHPTIYSFLLSDCLLLDVAPSLSPALAYGTIYGLPMSPQHHLFPPSEND